MDIEVLYFDGCPGHARVVQRLRELMADAGVEADILLRPVETPDAAVAARFLGSPTIRIDGVDVEPAADTRSDYGLKCRLYRRADGLRGTPADEWVAQALARAAAP